MTETLDLKPFCSTDPYRSYIAQPFSVGAYTYATNGHIIVRVSRRDDVPGRVGKYPVVARLYKSPASVSSWRPLRKIELPADTTEECDDCCGRGTVHSCHCETCDGSGRIVMPASVRIGDELFSLQYTRMLTVLPNIQVPEQVMPCYPDGKPTPMPFKFDGGDGLLMGLRFKYERHVEESL